MSYPIEGNLYKKLDPRPFKTDYDEDFLMRNTDEKYFDKSVNKDPQSRPLSAKIVEKKAGVTPRRKQNRPVSAKRNIIYATAKRNDASNLSRLRPAHIQMDKERLYDENMALKIQINSLKSENISIKTKIKQYEKEIKRKNEELEDFGNNDKSPGFKYMRLSGSLKQTIKDLKNECKAKDEEVTKLRKNMKISKVAELEVEILAYKEECLRLKQSYEDLMKKKAPETTLSALPEENRKKDVIIADLKKEKQDLTAFANSLQDEIFKLKEKIPDGEKGKKKSGRKENSPGLKFENQKLRIQIDNAIKESLEKDRYAQEENLKMKKAFEDYKSKLNEQEKVIQELRNKLQKATETPKNKQEPKIEKSLEIKVTPEKPKKEIQLIKPEEVTQYFDHICLCMQLHRYETSTLSDILLSCFKGKDPQLDSSSVLSLFTDPPFAFIKKLNLAPLCQYLVQPHEGRCEESEIKSFKQPASKVLEKIKKNLKDWKIFDNEEETQFDSDLGQLVRNSKKELKKACKEVDKTNSGIIDTQDFKSALNKAGAVLSPRLFEYMTLLFYSHDYEINKVPYANFIKAYSKTSETQEYEFDENKLAIIGQYLNQIAQSLIRQKLTTKEVFSCDKGLIYPENFISGLEFLNIRSLNQEVVLLLLDYLQYEKESESCISIDDLDKIMASLGVTNGKKSGQKSARSYSSKGSSAESGNLRKVSLLESDNYEYSEDSPDKLGISEISPFASASNVDPFYKASPVLGQNSKSKLEKVQDESSGVENEEKMSEIEFSLNKMERKLSSRGKFDIDKKEKSKKSSSSSSDRSGKVDEGKVRNEEKDDSEIYDDEEFVDDEISSKPVKMENVNLGNSEKMSRSDSNDKKMGGKSSSSSDYDSDKSKSDKLKVVDKSESFSSDHENLDDYSSDKQSSKHSIKNEKQGESEKYSSDKSNKEKIQLNKTPSKNSSNEAYSEELIESNKSSSNKHHSEKSSSNKSNPKNQSKDHLEPSKSSKSKHSSSSSSKNIKISSKKSESDQSITITPNIKPQNLKSQKSSSSESPYKHSSSSEKPIEAKLSRHSSSILSNPKKVKSPSSSSIASNPKKLKSSSSSSIPSVPIKEKSSSSSSSKHISLSKPDNISPDLQLSSKSSKSIKQLSNSSKSKSKKSSKLKNQKSSSSSSTSKQIQIKSHSSSNKSIEIANHQEKSLSKSSSKSIKEKNSSISSSKQIKEPLENFPKLSSKRSSSSSSESYSQVEFKESLDKSPSDKSDKFKVNEKIESAKSSSQKLLSDRNKSQENDYAESFDQDKEEFPLIDKNDPDMNKSSKSSSYEKFEDENKASDKFNEEKISSKLEEDEVVKSASKDTGEDKKSIEEREVEAKISKSSSSSIVEKSEFIDEDEKINVEKIEDSSIGNEKLESFKNIENFEKPVENKTGELDFSSHFTQNLKINVKNKHSEADSHKAHEGFEESENFESSKNQSDDFKHSSKKSSIASKNSLGSSPKSKHSSKKPESISKISEKLSEKLEKQSEHFEKSSKSSDKSQNKSKKSSSISIKSDKSSEKSFKPKSKISSKEESKSNLNSLPADQLADVDTLSFPHRRRKVKSNHSSSEPESVSDHHIQSQKKSESKSKLSKKSSSKSIKSQKSNKSSSKSNKSSSKSNKSSSKSSSKKIDSPKRKSSSSSSSSSSKPKKEPSPKVTHDEYLDNIDEKPDKPEIKKFSLSSMALGQGLAQRLLNPASNHLAHKSESNVDDSHEQPGHLSNVGNEVPAKISDTLEVGEREHVKTVNPLMKALVSQSISSNLENSLEDSFF